MKHGAAPMIERYDVYRSLDSVVCIFVSFDDSLVIRKYFRKYLKKGCWFCSH